MPRPMPLLLALYMLASGANVGMGYTNITFVRNTSSLDGALWTDKLKQMNSHMDGPDWSLLATQSSCLSCGPGNYAISCAATICQACAQGTYKSARGTATCIQCEIGTYMTSQGATVCLSCERGTYKTVQGSGVCIACPTGSTTSDDKSTSPVSCTCMAGYGPSYGYLNALVDTSSTCSAPGQVLWQDRGRLCQHPYANNEDISWIISTSQPNTEVAIIPTQLDTEDDYDGILVYGCTDITCTNSWYIGDWSGSLDEYYLHDASEMVKIVGRVVKVRFVSDNTNVGSGWEIRWQFISVECVQCGQGSYNIAENVSESSDFFWGLISTSAVVQKVPPCASCPPHTVSAAGALGVEDCKCAPGYKTSGEKSFSIVAPVTNSDCGRVTLRTATGIISSAIQTGYSSPALTCQWIIAPQCTNCYVDFFIARFFTIDSTLSLLSCQDDSCSSGSDLLRQWQGSGMIQDEIWSSTRVMMLELNVREYDSSVIIGFIGNWDTFYGACEACNAGSYSVISDNRDCIECDAGKNSLPAATTCELCPSGTFSAIGFTECSQCSAGTYGNTEGVTTCTACEAGSYSLSTGTACHLCSTGTYSSTSTTVCLECSAGTYGENEGLSACTTCEAGQYSSITGANESIVCDECPPGKYSTAIGIISAEDCSPCTIGTYSNISGGAMNTTCIRCEPGKYSSAPSAQNCLLCGAGQFSFLERATVCETCEVGKYAEPANNDLVSGNSICSDCLPGAYCRNGILNPCPVNTVNNNTGAGSRSLCRACPPGKYSPSEAQSNLAACLVVSTTASAGVSTPAAVNETVAIRFTVVLAMTAAKFMSAQAKYVATIAAFTNVSVANVMVENFVETQSPTARRLAAKDSLFNNSSALYLTMAEERLLAATVQVQTLIRSESQNATRIRTMVSDGVKLSIYLAQSGFPSVFPIISTTTPYQATSALRTTNASITNDDTLVTSVLSPTISNPNAGSSPPLPWMLLVMIGGPTVAVIISAAAVLLWWRRRKASAQQSEPTYQTTMQQMRHEQLGGPNSDNQFPSMLIESRPRPWEVESSDNRFPSPISPRLSPVSNATHPSQLGSQVVGTNNFSDVRGAKGSRALEVPSIEMSEWPIPSAPLMLAGVESGYRTSPIQVKILCGAKDGEYQESSRSKFEPVDREMARK